MLQAFNGTGRESNMQRGFFFALLVHSVYTAPNSTQQWGQLPAQTLGGDPSRSVGWGKAQIKLNRTIRAVLSSKACTEHNFDDFILKLCGIVNRAGQCPPSPAPSLAAKSPKSNRVVSDRSPSVSISKSAAWYPQHPVDLSEDSTMASLANMSIHATDGAEILAWHRQNAVVDSVYNITRSVRNRQRSARAER